MRIFMKVIKKILSMHQEEHVVHQSFKANEGAILLYKDIQILQPNDQMVQMNIHFKHSILFAQYCSFQD